MPAWLLGRLSLAWKFALITVVLAAPLGFVVQRYVDVQQTNEEFSARERLGIELVGPLFSLETVLVDARTAVSAGGAVASDQIVAAIQAVQGVADSGAAAELGVIASWDDLAASITAAVGRRGRHSRTGLRGVERADRCHDRADRRRRGCVEPHARPRPRHLLPDGHRHHEGAHAHGSGGRPARVGDVARDRGAGDAGGDPAGADRRRCRSDRGSRSWSSPRAAISRETTMP